MSCDEGFKVECNSRGAPLPLGQRQVTAEEGAKKKRKPRRKRRGNIEEKDDDDDEQQQEYIENIAALELSAPFL